MLHLRHLAPVGATGFESDPTTEPGVDECREKTAADATQDGARPPDVSASGAEAAGAPSEQSTERGRSRDSDLPQELAAAADGGAGTQIATSGIDGTAELDPVEGALAGALAAAAVAGRFDVVSQLARELEARRHGRAGNVVRFDVLTRRGNA
jgi:hypothetical protein